MADQQKKGELEESTERMHALCNVMYKILDRVQEMTKIIL